ncbi:MAG: hypothetical protein EKK48_10595 [Candidatus Melainabacteria bacterium]|nr:MAG: hypothetical protein EKK48_10595 [Candidatus Melainabacteria bacterium]
MQRLFNLSAEFADKLQHMSPAQQTYLKRIACCYAIKTAGIDDQVVLQALAELNAGKTLSLTCKQELQQKLEYYDECYFNLSETDSSEDAGKVEFHKARAISALIEATKADSFDAAADAIYEASMTSDNQDELIQQFLKGAGH